MEVGFLCYDFICLCWPTYLLVLYMCQTKNGCSNYSLKLGLFIVIVITPQLIRIDSSYGIFSSLMGA